MILIIKILYLKIKKIIGLFFIEYDNSIIIQRFLEKPLQAIKFADVNKKNIALKRLRKYFIKNDKNNLRNEFYKYYKILKKIVRVF